MDLATRILAIRTRMGLSQEKFGELVGKSQRTVAAWESGSRAPSFATLCELADALDVSVDYLLGRTEIPNIYQTADNRPHQQPQPVQMPQSVGELSDLIQQIVDHTLAERNNPNRPADI
jgi:transcriptional regulator with XRE-family HTH domain